MLHQRKFIYITTVQMARLMAAAVKWFFVIYGRTQSHTAMPFEPRMPLTTQRKLNCFNRTVSAAGCNVFHFVFRLLVASMLDSEPDSTLNPNAESLRTCTASRCDFKARLATGRCGFRRVRSSHC